MGFFSKLFGKKEPVEQEPPYPSWVLDQSKMQDFANTLKQMARERNIPEKFIYGLMENDYSRDKLLFTAGLLEKFKEPLSISKLKLFAIKQRSIGIIWTIKKLV